MSKYNTTEAFEALKEYMVNNCNAKIASGGKEIIKRCHFCGDSRDSSSAHLYIGLRNDGSIVYNCFKCNSHGVVDGRFLRDIGCYDIGLITLCMENNKNSNQSNNNAIKQYSPRSNKFYTNRLIIPQSNDEFSIKKLGYLSKRLGVNIGLEDVESLRVILNLNDFLSVNNINNLTRHPDIVDVFSKFFIGFLTTDGSYVILRRVVQEKLLDPSIDLRYTNYNVFGNNNGNKYYTVPASIDVNKPITVRISEGIFDILSVMYNITGREDNTIFCAANGKGYLSMISFLISTYGLVGFDLDLYMDNDVDKYTEDKIINVSKVFTNHINVHHNVFDGEKDFGVPKDRIKDSIIRRK